ncbi:hypothetical protein B0H16DRAFT_1702051 [Mycena metata]|uniref:Uncharacterized protein n=1 Tax=Mycena metata TaxID=1033252 RepID=A0AAD7H865_9AGAR|nr:hypothetical protein B0H16DRAFT_1702051 [Mycena metata]
MLDCKSSAQREKGVELQTTLKSSWNSMSAREGATQAAAGVDTVCRRVYGADGQIMWGGSSAVGSAKARRTWPQFGATGKGGAAGRRRPWTGVREAAGRVGVGGRVGVVREWDVGARRARWVLDAKGGVVGCGRGRQAGCGRRAAVCGGCGGFGGQVRSDVGRGAAMQQRQGAVGRRRGRLGRGAWCGDTGGDGSALIGDAMPSSAPGLQECGGGLGYKTIYTTKLLPRSPRHRAVPSKSVKVSRPSHAIVHHTAAVPSKPARRPSSVAAVWFGAVQHQYFANLEPNPGSGSAKPPNLEPDLGSRFDGVRFRFRRGGDGFEPNFLPTVQTGGKQS